MVIGSTRAARKIRGYAFDGASVRTFYSRDNLWGGQVSVRGNHVTSCIRRSPNPSRRSASFARISRLGRPAFERCRASTWIMPPRRRLGLEALVRTTYRRALSADRSAVQAGTGARRGVTPTGHYSDLRLRCPAADGRACELAAGRAEHICVSLGARSATHLAGTHRSKCADEDAASASIYALESYCRHNVKLAATGALLLVDAAAFRADRSLADLMSHEAKEREAKFQQEEIDRPNDGFSLLEREGVTTTSIEGLGRTFSVPAR